MSDLLTSVQAAELTGLGRNMIGYHIKAGNLTAIETVRGYLIERGEVERFIRERPKSGWRTGKKRKPAQTEVSTG